jgi:hypothetical protein
VNDGPALDTPLQLGGYYIVECDTIDQATDLAAKIPGAMCGKIEVRPVLEFSWVRRAAGPFKAVVPRRLKLAVPKREC